MSLPSLYALLAQDRVVDFPALRPHQRHAWHAFLAQLATVALDRNGYENYPESAIQWESLLRGLTPEYEAAEPWCLVVDDSRQPAFMQPPAPTGLADFRRFIETPDDLDVLVTSKNHDVKQSVALQGEAEDWVFALVDLQTMSGFLGAGNYGIARMNGGFSSASGHTCSKTCAACLRGGKNWWSAWLRTSESRVALRCYGWSRGMV